MLSRRAFAGASIAAFLSSACFGRLVLAAGDGFGALAGQLAKIETESGGRLGVARL